MGGLSLSTAAGHTGSIQKLPSLYSLRHVFFCSMIAACILHCASVVQTVLTCQNWEFQICRVACVRTEVKIMIMFLPGIPLTSHSQMCLSVMFLPLCFYLFKASDPDSAAVLDTLSVYNLLYFLVSSETHLWKKWTRFKQQFPQQERFKNSDSNMMMMMMILSKHKKYIAYATSINVCFKF